jgi:nicotinamide phosphoribosyltransferase
MIFKNPKTDDGNFKKSQRGMCCVFRNEDGEITYQDDYDKNTFPKDKENLLKPVFRDGKMLKEFTLKEIRETLHGGKF